MNRRGFLQGLFGGVTAGGVIITASDAEIARFAAPLETPVLLDALPPPPDPATVRGQRLYNADGELVAIAQSLNISRDGAELTATFVGIAHIPGFHMRGAPPR